MSKSQNDIVEVRVCRTCAEEKPVADFYVRTDGRLNRLCKVCHNADSKTRRDADREGYNARQRNLKRGGLDRKYALKSKYNLTSEAYDAMLEAQGGGCAACGAEPSRRALSTDHDHETGEVRGILCDGCNLALGHVGDDPDRLRALATYLETR